MSAGIGMLVLLGACGTSPDPCADVPGEVLCAYRTIRVGDARLTAAVAKGVEALRAPEWLGASELRVGTIRTAERRVLIDTSYRATFDLIDGERARPARIVVTEDRQGLVRLVEAELGPVGSAAPLPEAPGLDGEAAGWSDLPAADPEVGAALEAAEGLLASPDWLRRPVDVRGVLAARRRVSGGPDTYLALDVAVGGFAHRVDVLLNQPPSSPAALTWMRLGAL